MGISQERRSVTCAVNVDDVGDSDRSDCKGLVMTFPLLLQAPNGGVQVEALFRTAARHVGSTVARVRQPSLHSTSPHKLHYR